MKNKREQYSEELESEYRRVERSYQKVLKDFNRESFSKSSEEMLDSAFEFFKLAYHLREWIKKDTKVDQNIKDQIPSFIDNGLQPDNSTICLPICRDLANLKKHRGFDLKYKPNDPDIKLETSGQAFFRVPQSDLDKAASLKKAIHLKNEDAVFMGTIMIIYRKNAYEVKGTVECCMHFWKQFFEKNDLLMPKIL